MNNNKVSIEWESTGYSVLKNLDASILGILCEFIDNSIQSYKDEKEALLKIDPEYKLKIEINFTGRELTISDNAGGIELKNWLRALKPANKSTNVEGLNEFGLGMKYAAVWISNEWELISKSHKESVQRKVVFDYDEVIKSNIKELDFTEEITSENNHGTKELKTLMGKIIKGNDGKGLGYMNKRMSLNFVPENLTFEVKKGSGWDKLSTKKKKPVVKKKSLVKKKKFIVYDMRNIYSPKKMKESKIKYFGIGR